MPASCVTVAEFLTWSGTEFVTFGANSTGNLTVASVGVAGQTITVGGVVLTATAGARTSGSDDFDVTGPVAAIATDIAAAVNDPANSFSAIVTASLRTPGLAIVDFVSVSTGVYSLLPMVTSEALVYVLSGATLTGGDDMLDDIVTCTCQMLDPVCWGVKRSCAHEYLAAHFITIASGGAGGVVASKSIDKISISYAVTPPSDPDLGSTKWGILYLALRGSIVRFGAVAGSTGNPRLGVVC